MNSKKQFTSGKKLNNCKDFSEIIYFFRYDIEIMLLEPDFKREIQNLIDKYDLKAIILGNRRTDPWSRDLE